MKAIISKRDIRRKKEKDSARGLLIVSPNPILNVVCDQVTDFQEVPAIMEKMHRVLRAYPNSVGLAAPQVGVVMRVIAIFPRRAKIMFMVNPVLEAGCGPVLVRKEGCLSYPGVFKPVARCEDIVVSYFDGRGLEHNLERFTGWQARVIQHELDHLNGVCQVGTGGRRA
jgi:peptide deformylase